MMVAREVARELFGALDRELDVIEGGVDGAAVEFLEATPKTLVTRAGRNYFTARGNFRVIREMYETAGIPSCSISRNVSTLRSSSANDRSV